MEPCGPSWCSGRRFLCRRRIDCGRLSRRHDPLAALADGEELLAFFVEPQTRKWVAWTPTGYYMASAGGEDLIGWQLNRGWNQEADFFPASQFRAQYNRPDIVRLVLQDARRGRSGPPR